MAKKRSGITIRQDREKEKMLQTLRATPIVQIACQQAGISRATYYRWRHDDEAFAKVCDAAIAEGTELISDLAESKLINGIRDQQYSAISFWLRHRHPAYADKLQIQAKVQTEELGLTPEQEAVVQRALQLVQQGYDEQQSESDQK